MGADPGHEKAKAKAEVKGSVLLDSSGWVAAAIPAQTLHEAAKTAYTSAVRQGSRIIVTPMVLGESQALFLRLLGRNKAAAALEGALRDPTHVVYPIDDALVRAAMDRWILRYRDQNFSLCDAVSFEVMRRERITHALSIDRHFVTAGFEIIS